MLYIHLPIGKNRNGKTYSIPNGDKALYLQGRCESLFSVLNQSTSTEGSIPHNKTQESLANAPRPSIRVQMKIDAKWT